MTEVNSFDRYTLRLEIPESVAVRSCVYL